jgi:histone H3/H4
VGSRAAWDGPYATLHRLLRKVGRPRMIHSVEIVFTTSKHVAARARGASTQHHRQCTSGILSIDAASLCTHEGRVGVVEGPKVAAGKPMMTDGSVPGGPAPWRG